MESLRILFNNNQKWAEECKKKDANYFKNLSLGQNPEYLWIGCSDSRVPANEIIGLSSGDLFVHRNVANLVYMTDLNCLSALQYAVEALQVKHVIICGHYGCGGVKAAMENQELGLIDNWIYGIKDVIMKHKAELDAILDFEKRFARLCELNVIEQMYKVAHTDIVQDAWDRGQKLYIHAWIFDIETGLIVDLERNLKNIEQIDPTFRMKTKKK